ncbi:protein kinase domain-containing protein [Thermomonospora cellulosilytica]|uniref:Serine/threonine protein kinase/cyclophilin family peptidyl-prolyl cis-trans isomerase n=1 Tax=Thermomonospora cellulosilytica TaxID=1411118 RepID=A0A7W3MXW5_9ACTN|nr:peptidylprolyl isomerase [Thermomonospora cellulosilytica]MBA9003912.1 serine/threonine protein kinase/cyclophilin family peptidyl-prolyl cis-trans isomerase [Thermomonospora cellulosilytica]
MPPQPRPLRPNDPREIGGYALVGRLGEGGQGTVYLGRSDSGRQVAVKVLRADLEEGSDARRYLDRELAAVRRVAPFCTARIITIDVDGDQPYVVSEYIDGPSLQRQVAEQGPLHGDELLRLAIGTATALAAIHQAGVVHRDLKPANVLLGPDGPRVIDFGIARPLDATSATMSAAVGTPAYMAPEQLAAGSAGPPLDMFAWGCTMAFAANGVPPFGNDSIPAVMQRILHGEPALGALGGPLRDLVAACLDKDPARRPTALQALTALLGGGEHRDPLTEGTWAAASATPPPAPRPPATLPQAANRPPATSPSGRSSSPPQAVAPPPFAVSPIAPPPGPPYSSAPSPPPRSRAGQLAVAAAAAVLLVLGGTTAVLLNRDGPGDPGAAVGPSPSFGTTASSPTTTRQGEEATNANGTCRYLAATNGTGEQAGTPPARPAADGPVPATLTTDRGTIALELDGAKAPCAVNSIIHLAGRGFYDGNRCHRLTTVSSLRILQCGDPTGDGTGGPGYRYAVENTENARYTRGVVAMARSSEPDSNGSQFFIVYGDAQIPPDYTIVGRVTSGMEVVDRVAQGGVEPGQFEGDGVPKTPITIQRFRTGT